ncbi:MAG: DUF3800 domain-containing protein [bacterium]|nr:DUF3800 domain-containing protein [bacterium]
MQLIDNQAYIFLDESGKPEIFSRKGINLVITGNASKYLIISAIRVDDHLLLQQEVTKLRLSILQNSELTSKFSPSYSLDTFHAQTDYPEVKRAFYNWINLTNIEMKITVVVAEKLKAYSTLQQNPNKLYGTIAGQLLKRTLHNAQNFEVIFSRRDSSLKSKENLQKIIDVQRLSFIQTHKINTNAQLVYHHNPHYSHGGLQIADYIAYAVFQVFERKNRMWYEMIKNRIGYIQDIFNKKSYSKDNPL